MPNTTAVILVATGLVLLAWETYVLARRRTDATISAVTLLLSVVHPPLAFLWFVLGSHFFWPRCGLAGTQVVAPRVGMLLALGAVIVLVWEITHRIAVPTIAKVEPAYFGRLALMAIFGTAMGHWWFGQYIECVPS